VTGRAAALVILGVAALAGAGLFYLEQFHWYEVRAPGDGVVTLTRADGNATEIAVTDLQVAEGAASPLKYRACFRLAEPLDAAAADFRPYAAPEPTVAPLTFPCFDADAIADALQSGEAAAFLGRGNEPYGIDRVVALWPDGRGHAWHQINRCGARVFDGDPPPEGCPPPPLPD